MKTASTTYAVSSGRSRQGVKPLLAALILMVAALSAPAVSSSGDCCPEPDLTLYFTSDTRGMLRRCGCSEGQMGGISARASYIKGDSAGRRALVVDSGDTFFDGLEVRPERRGFYALKARTMAEAMDAAGYGAAAVGEYDLAYGPEFLSDAAAGAGFPFLCANASWDRDGSGCAPFAGSAVVELDGLNVGVVGVLGAGFPYADFTASFGDIRVTDPAAAAKREIESVREVADLVVVLTHLSVDPVEELAGRLEGADIVIQGHSGEHMEAPRRVGGTLLLKGYTMGKHLGRLDIWLDSSTEPPGRGNRVSSFEFRVVGLDESIPPDPEVERIISAYRQALKEREFVFERPGPEGAAGYAGPQRCMKCHLQEYRNWSETAHAHAFSSLEEKGDQYDPECLPCHTTGYGYTTGFKTAKTDPGLVDVSCESCHGAGETHAQGKGAVRRAVAEDVCRSCHDEANSPQFDYEYYMELGGAHRGAASGPE